VLAQNVQFTAASTEFASNFLTQNVRQPARVPVKNSLTLTKHSIFLGDNHGRLVYIASEAGRGFGAETSHRQTSILSGASI
jgi:hypothetical protein